MKKRRNRSDSSAWMALPLYIFTIVFVVCPLIYMVALSFATPSRGFGRTQRLGNLEKNLDRKSTRLNSSHDRQSRMPSSA